jgi:hypothetical protein
LFLLLSLFHPGIFEQRLCWAAGPASGSNVPRVRLFNGSAYSKAEEHRGSVRTRVPAANADSGGIVDAAELDTVTEILNDHRSGADFFSDYRTPFYLSYVSEVVPLGDLDDWEEREAAQKLFIYQAASSASKLLMNSGLQPLYRQALDAVRWFRDYTSLKVQREDNGVLRVANGSNHEKPLLELKLHVSANNGVEPRLEIGDNFTLRYDIIHDETLVEFRRDF